MCVAAPYHVFLWLHGSSRHSLRCPQLFFVLQETINPKGFPDKSTEEVEALKEKNLQEVQEDDNLGEIQRNLEEASQRKTLCDAEIQKTAEALGKKEEQVKQHDRLRKDLQECIESITEMYGVDCVDPSDTADFSAALTKVIDDAKQAQRNHKNARAEAQVGPQHQ